MTNLVEKSGGFQGIPGDSGETTFARKKRVLSNMFGENDTKKAESLWNLSGKSYSHAPFSGEKQTLNIWAF